MSFFYQNRQEQLYLYLSKNNPYAVHLHRQLELIYVLSGSTTVTVEQQDFLLTPGQGVLVFPNQMHGLKHVEPGQNLLCIFEPDFCHSFRQFFQNKKPAHNDFTVSSLSEHSRIALQGLKTLAAAMEKDRPTPSDVQVYAEGYLTLLLADLLRRPEIDYPLIAGMIGWGEGITPMLAERLETEIKYAGYIARQDRMIHEVARHEKTLIPEDFSYTELTGLTLEAREKLARIRPKNLGQAGRIPGVSPSDVAQLSIALAAKRS